jgi:Cdc6-like AAA superfamily ATPase
MSAEMSISTPDHIRGGLDQTSESMAEAEQQLLLRQLVLMDPRESQQRHQDIHLQGSHKWFLQSSEFKEWQEKDDMLLLITGLPGTGKTMLMTSIINHLESIFTRTDPGILAFHFFELLDSRATNATSMLRSMIYLLVSQQNWLLTHLWEKYKVAGVQLFEGENAFNALSSVFQNILRDPRLQPVYLVVDALDECKEGLSLLLDLIDRTKHDRETRVKWIVSSREYPQIKRWMLDIEGCSHMVLGVSNAYHSNLGLFVDNNVSELTKEKNLSNELQDKIRNFLLKRADTFLYVSMSCNHMKSQTVGGIRHYLQSMQTLENKDLIPNQLSVLYDKIFANIEKAESPEIVRHRLSVISVVAFAYRPLHYLELSMLTDVKGEENESLTLENVWKTCGSILSRRENVVYVVHQSVRDYILHNNVFEEPLVHFNVFSRSLRVLSEVLHRDMYSVQHVGTSYVSAKLQTPNPDPLASIEYSSIFWVKHICDAVSSRSQYKYVLRDHGDVFLFLQKHFLHLLESLSLLGQLSKGIFPLKLLLRVIQVCRLCDDK